MKMVSGIIATALASLSITAYAHGLAIANSTHGPLTFTVNNSCSITFGVVHEMEIKTISQRDLNEACSNYNSPCKIVAYDGANCGGKEIGGMKYLDPHSIKVFSKDNKVSVSATDRSLFFTSAL